MVRCRAVCRMVEEPCVGAVLEWLLVRGPGERGDWSGGRRREEREKRKGTGGEAIDKDGVG